ncbi:MAG: Vacuolar protein sorting-associated protein 35 [Chaenotheca gracillima]|nr:MAG: Vacuolar protein sorting-associated protein 35 [Chaenotheca gracillima]
MDDPAKSRKHAPAAYPGSLHHFAPRLVAFEHAPPSTDSSSRPSQNILLFIGGLGDGLLTVPYTPSLSAHLPASWSLAQIMLSSSYIGWGTSSVSEDAKEIGQCVSYFRDLRGPNTRVVLLGHSTGCQDVMEYMTGKQVASRPRVDGAIMQAPVSDREGSVYLMSPEVYARSVKVAREYVARGDGEDILPTVVSANFFGSPCSARRWLSLASPDHDGDEDFFSSDLTDEQLKSTFGSLGNIDTPLCILYSGKDQFVPPFVDKQGLVDRWISISKAAGGRIDEKHSGLIKEGDHTFKDLPREVLEDLERRVIGFIKRVDSGDFRSDASEKL